MILCRKFQYTGTVVAYTNATFTKVDNVAAGKSYECRVNMSAPIEGTRYSSGKSEPSLVTSKELSK